MLTRCGAAGVSGKERGMRKEDREAIRQNFLGQEDGHIFFFYRPRGKEAHGPQDVEKIYVVMHPFDAKSYRLIALDTASLPEEGDPFNMIVGNVLKVNDKQSVILSELGVKTEMVMGATLVAQGAARPCGEGVYTLIMQGNKAHLIYLLELPAIDGKVKEGLRIGGEGNFLVGVYNPYYESPPETQAQARGPALPESLKIKLDNERIVYDDVKELLDYEGTKLAFFRESTKHLGSIKQELHPLADNEKTADLFGDLKVQREKFPVEPLIKGEWR